MTIFATIASEINATSAQVDAAVTLLDDGATVPFIARYRKEVTGGLDDTQLRTLEERLVYLRDLNRRRDAILEAIEAQGQLSAELRAAIVAADSKTRLEDLYAPYRKKRRTKAQIATEAGLDKLLDSLLAVPDTDPVAEAFKFIDAEAGFVAADAVLDGAAQIFFERCQDNAELVGKLRERAWNEGLMTASVVKAKSAEAEKFKDYFEYQEPLRKIPSHRALAVFRGRAEGFLRLKVVIPEQDGLADPQQTGVCEREIARAFLISDRGRAADSWLQQAVRNAWRFKLSIGIETDLFGRLRDAAEYGAIEVFGHNLRDLLLAAPAGPRVTLGLDPGLRTGVKVVVVDGTGKLLDDATIYPHVPRKQWDESLHVLATLARKHRVELISVGNGTASRETDKLARELIRNNPDLTMRTLVVSEAGASVYSASELASREFPNLDVSLRGAVSIARRLQDPLSELVKIDPQSIGVGQYQHDVNQSRLARKLDAVVEDCVNGVGIDLNTASVPLLTRVAGLSSAMATNIVEYRETHGRFTNRSELKKVLRLGPKAFEQCAGFLRIADGDNPLDGSAVHPESYPLVEHILRQSGRLSASDKGSLQNAIKGVIGDLSFLSRLVPANLATEQFGEPTVADIVAELAKPGRDPRGEFHSAAFSEAVQSMEDLKPGMMLEGVVTNVANFGAFVDIGVHQDGLVHVSALADRFVKDPREVVKTGDVVRVKVVSVEPERRRIGLSMRSDDRSAPGASDKKAQPTGGSTTQRARPDRKTVQEAPLTALGAAFGRAKS